MADVDELIVVFNSGSSSLKVGVFARGEDGDERVVMEGGAEGIGRSDGAVSLKDAKGAVLVSREHTAEAADAAMEVLAGVLGEHMGAPAAVGHRVVHGGPKLREPVRLTAEVIGELEAAVHFAPLHIPAAVKVIRKASSIYREVPEFACFDTTFHRTMPASAAHLPIPAKYFEEGVQKYGFHGLSCESVMHRLGAEVPRRVVIAHMGGGSSVTAVLEGKSIDTSMGLSPTGGVPMATRSGDLDPGVMLYLLRSGVSVDDLEQMVNHDCGMGALAGGETDMRELEKEGDAGARLAVEVFATAVRKTIGGYWALMGGMDLLVFTGGIGEHDAAMRGAHLRGTGVGVPGDGGAGGVSDCAALPGNAGVKWRRRLPGGPSVELTLLSGFDVHSVRGTWVRDMTTPG